ncbi:hypothetical protein CISIN_1g039126mg, partial [Citrus sinensis]
WHGCPFKSLSSIIRPKNLVSPEIPRNSIKQLWKVVQRLVNLKSINLNHSEHLTEIPSLSLATNLESLNFQRYTSLLETHSSIRHLNKFVARNLKHCRSLTNLSTSIHLESLKKLILSGCSNLMSFPELFYNIKELSLDGTAINELPSSIEYLSKLVILNLGNSSRLEGLPSKICKLKSLQHLNLSCCSNLESFPNELRNLFPCDLYDIEAHWCSSLETLSGLSIIFTKISRNTQSFDFINCFKLHQNVVQGIINNAQLKLQLPTSNLKTQAIIIIVLKYNNSAQSNVNRDVREPT